MLGQPFRQRFLTLLLHLTVVAAQDGQYLGFCLRRTDKVDPGRLDMLRLRGEDFHLVATL